MIIIIFNISNSYKKCKNDGFVRNELYTQSDINMLDNKQILVLNYSNNRNNLKTINNNDLYLLLKNNLSNKLDINKNRLQYFNINKDNRTIIFTINGRKSSSEQTNNQIVDKLKNYYNQSIKIYNNSKDI